MATTLKQRPTATALGAQPVTAEELLEMHASGKRGELIRGVFCPTMSATAKHGVIVANLIIALGAAVKPDGLGRIMGSDSGVKIESDPDTVREPDVAFFSRERWPLDRDMPGYAEVSPDIVAEIYSPSDSVREINDKARMWLDTGVQLVWVLYPDTKLIEVHRPNEPIATLRENDTLTGMDILPGFSASVAAIFAA